MVDDDGYPDDNSETFPNRKADQRCMIIMIVYLVIIFIGLITAPKPHTTLEQVLTNRF